jgi:hypothetical protein
MNKRIIAISILVEAILFVSVFAATIFYYNGVLTIRNSKIASLNSQIANLNSEITNTNSQISNFKGQLTNLTTAYLATALGATEISTHSVYTTTPLPYKHLYITGSVTNKGEGTAYNAGLHVVGYDVNGNGTLDIDMIVPLGDGTFGTDSGTAAWVSSNYGSSPTQLGILHSGETATISIAIFHEGTVSNWTLTPVWTNSP